METTGNTIAQSRLVEQEKIYKQAKADLLKSISIIIDVWELRKSTAQRLLSERDEKMTKLLQDQIDYCNDTIKKAMHL